MGKQVSRETLIQKRGRFVFVIEQDDFVLSRIGTIGKTRFLPTGKDYCLSHALVVIKVYSPLIDKRWLRRTVVSDSVLSQARGGVQSVGVPDLGMGKIRSILIPFPPLKEQYRMVAEIDRRFSIISEVEAQVNATLKRGERLQQSILTEALFRWAGIKRSN